MATTYNLEPNPTAKVILHTTAGDLELELFAKQTPKTSRNFLQLCLDGYYDDTIFHRIVKGFILQGGDPTGTGHGGESIYDRGTFEDEFHSRLKFNRRGLLGMANTGEKDDNGSQFFFTLGNTPELTGKNTMFGRIQGDTIYNLLKISEAEIAEGSEDRPLYPSKITGAEIIINPFEDMVKRAKVADRSAPEEKKAKKPKRKAGKALLSFGDDGEEEEAAPLPKKAKYNAALVSGGGGGKPTSAEVPKASAKQQAIPIRKPARKSPSPSPVPQRSIPSPPRQKAKLPSPMDDEPPEQTKLERVNAQIAAVKASMKRTTKAPSSAPKKKLNPLLQSMVPLSTTQGRKRGAGQDVAAEQAAVDILAKFKSKLENAPPSTATSANTTGKDQPVGTALDVKEDEEEAACDLHFVVGCQSCTAWDKKEDEESDDDTGWMSHSLSFAKDRLGKDLEWKRKNEEELVVIDPRERAAELKSNRKGKRDWDEGKEKRGKKGVGLGAR